jgi:hypothetical protein
MNPDDAYATLAAMHRGLDEQQSALVTARLVLLLANALDDADRLAALAAEARAIFDTPISDTLGNATEGGSR